MKVLIDSHVFLWWVLEEPRLTPAMREIISDGTNEVLFSAASAYELAYKADDGRLTLPEGAHAYITDRLDANGFDPLPIDVGHALAAASLPRIHRDPFDRLLIAQAQREGIPILTADPVIARYDVETIT
jgi:PIN domain nuclease of toxin-antitoxin system